MSKAQEKKENYRAHPVFERPQNRQSMIWRYMDFTKFVSMLAHRGLYFARADLLGDPFEGSMPKMSVAARRAFAKEHNMPGNALDGIGQFLRFSRGWTFISSWHMNEVESAAMWQLYAKSGEAIAVRSTFERLDECVGDTCYIGVVKYVDYDTDVIPTENLFYPYIHKRLSFAHEREVRALIQELPTTEGKLDYQRPPSDEGRWVDVDLAALVSDVFVAPTAPDWLRPLVKDVCAKYGLDKEVRQSAISAQPIY